jgi:8-hydroxy-5-deazaflavin:NADPH oxidoreductase
LCAGWGHVSAWSSRNARAGVGSLLSPTDREPDLQIAILGASNVGGALGKGWARTGHRITYGVPNPADPKYQSAAAAAANPASRADALRDAEVIVLAVPFGAGEDVLRAAGDLKGRIILDATNPSRMNGPGLELSMGFTQSGGEYVTSRAVGASAWVQRPS